MKIARHSSKQRTPLYATSGDFCRIFAEDTKNLYLLALMLTADSEKAEQCLVSGLDDCFTGNQVFAEWARSWARRVVIKNAIRMIAPRTAREGRNLHPAVVKGAQLWKGGWAQPAPLEVAAVLELPDFERFAFVISLLEGYSDQDCALLLSCTRESFMEARVRALQQVGRQVEAHNGRARDNGFKAEPVRDRRGSIEEVDFPVQLATPA